MIMHNYGGGGEGWLANYPTDKYMFKVINKNIILTNYVSKYNFKPSEYSISIPPENAKKRQLFSNFFRALEMGRFLLSNVYKRVGGIFLFC